VHAAIVSGLRRNKTCGRRDAYLEEDPVRKAAVSPHRRIAIAWLALLLAACASTPPPPPAPFVVKLAPTPPAGGAAPLSMQPMRVDDGRDVPDRTRIGEVHAPAFVSSAGLAPEVATGLLLLGFAVPTPTGRYLTVADSSEVAGAVEHALSYALLGARRVPLNSGALEVTVRQFWMRPWWTTTCDVALDVRVLGSAGQVRWEQALESHVGKFEGWFTVEAFERVATLCLDELVAQATAVFGSTQFGAAVAAER